MKPRKKQGSYFKLGSLVRTWTAIRRSESFSVNMDFPLDDDVPASVCLSFVPPMSE